MLHFPPNYFFSQEKVETQTPINPYYHWVCCQFLLYTKCYTGVTF